MEMQSDSRKRPLDSDGDDGITKRSNQGNLGKTWSLSSTLSLSWSDTDKLQ